MVCVELNLPVDARKSLQEAVRLDPGNAYYNYALGAVLVQANNPDEAIGYFQKCRELRPQDVRATLALAIAYFYSYRYDDARHELQPIAERPETRMVAQLFLGRMAMRDGNLGEAMEHLQKSVRADPSATEAYTDLGMVYIDRKEYALAEKTLAHAIQLAPDDYLSNQRLLTLSQRTKDPRADAQAERVEQLRKTGQERERLLMRTVEVRPY
jgi:Flp pilus assembly protein TadD